MLISGKAGCVDGHTNLQVIGLFHLTIRYCTMALGLHQLMLNNVHWLWSSAFTSTWLCF